jgi:hypothetical protein
LINAGAFPGRIIPNFLADKFGILNVIPPINLITTVLLFALFGITTAASGPIIAFAVLYGFFSGASKVLFILTSTVPDAQISTLSLSTTYCHNGQAPKRSRACSSVASSECFELTLSSSSVRFGISWFLVGFGALMGNPVTGALLGETYDWSKALLWCGVGVVPHYFMNDISYTTIQISSIIATIGLVITRQLFYRKKQLEATSDI